MEGAKFKLLIADDEENILNRMSKYIKNHMDCFSHIYTAKSGSEALDILYRHRPDIMLMDVQMR